MSFTLAKVKQICTPCFVAIYDVGCALCVELLRMATGCFCTCVNIAAEACATITAVANCGCPDGTTEPGSVIDGAWFGYTIPAEIYSLVAQYCPDDPHLKLELFGSRFDPVSGVATTNLICPTTAADWDPVSIDGSPYQIDPAGGAVVRDVEARCVAGAFFLTAAELLIETLPLEEGAPPGSAQCRQRFGRAAYALRFSAACNDKVIVFCPFPGVVAVEASCGAPPGYCAAWTLTGTLQTGCAIELTFTHTGGECELVCVVDGETLTGDSYTIIRAIDPCEPGASLTLTVTRTWDPSCFHNCAINNGSVDYTFYA